VKIGQAVGKMRYIYKLIISVVVCQGAGIIGSIFTAPAIADWYITLQKPFFTPPNWLFAPAWITLFLLMGIAASIIWHIGLEERPVRVALVLFIGQLILNALWSFAFFGMESPLLGMIVIVALWVAILATIVRFFRISSLAGWLMIPYIGWVTFAGILNVAIYMLNS